jgi:serine/threonine protein kinase
MDGDHIDICELGWALRLPKNTPIEEDGPLPPPGGLDPQYIAPEYYGSSGGAWNGFSADLWATGLMLFSMVVDTGALFSAPISEDKSFARLCIKGDIRGQAEKYGKMVGKSFVGLSDELIDLLRSMLRADSKQRLSLEQVTKHPWLTTENAMTPTEWTQRYQS